MEPLTLISLWIGFIGLVIGAITSNRLEVSEVLNTRSLKGLDATTCVQEADTE